MTEAMAYTIKFTVFLELIYGFNYSPKLLIKNLLGLLPIENISRYQ